MRSCPHWLFAAALVLTLPPLTRAQVPPEKAEATFTVAEGLEFKLWAAEPLCVNPTTMDIDHLGRVWMCEAINYRRRLRGQPPLRKEGDRIVILVDSNGDGRADKAETFYQSPELESPIGIAVAKDAEGPGWRVYVCQSPDLLMFEDKDGDGKADGPPRKLLTGFGGIDHDHGIHGISIGPDGKLYFSVGDQGVKNLKDKNGKVWSSNQTDCRAGTIWRCDMDGGQLELIAHNFRNNYMPAVDSFGTIFISDNDDDGLQQTRICYVMPGGNYGYHPRGPGQSHWHEEQPGIVHKVLRTYFGSPTGMCFYEGTLLPEKYRGMPLHTDAGPRHLRCYHTKPNGAGYDVEPENIVSSTDNWFRPSDVKVAPDGSVFVADWYDPGVGGHGMGDTTRGRIFRLAPKGNKPSVPKADLTTNDGILAALGSPCNAVRWMAIDTINHLSDDQADAVIDAALAQTAAPVLQARALWQLRKPFDRAAALERLEKATRDQDVPFQLLKLRVLKDRANKSPVSFNVPRAQYDGKPAAIAREVLLLSRDADPEHVKFSFYDLAKLYDGQDRFYLSALNIAAGTDPKRRAIILADFDKQFPEWNDKVADLVWELRPPGVMPRLAKLLTDGQLTAAQRGRIVDILAADENAAAGESLLALLKAEAPAEVRDAVVKNLAQFLPGKWKSLRTSAALKAAVGRLLAHADTAAAGLALVAAAEDAGFVNPVRELAGDSKQPEAVRRQAVKTLGELPTADAVVALKSVNGPLAVEAVRATAGQFSMRNKKPGGDAALAWLKEIVANAKTEPAVASAALEALAGNMIGTEWLLQAKEKGTLPEGLVAETGRLLRGSPFQGLRNRAMLLFPAPGKIDPKKLPPLAELARRKGDVNRGKQILMSSLKSEVQCVKCHMVRGQGGQIGPDLSMIGKKASRENLFESILYPSKAIADQYITWQVQTTSGQVLQGLLMQETETTLTLRDANGKDTVIDLKDVDERAKSTVSLMPADLVGGLTPDELVDLVEYLTTLQTPALTFDRWSILGPFANGPGDAGLDKDHGPESKLDFAASLPGKDGTVTWKSVSPDGTGYVDLQAHFGTRSNDIVSYLSRSVESPVDQEGTVLIGTDDAAKLFVNGEVVYVTRAHDAAVPEKARVKVRLRKGVNEVLLKITNGDGAHGFYFTLLSEQELKPVALPTLANR